MIYTLITSPVEGISVISNLQFIQRFRAAPKIDGEAAYCLTNLEAAITFLEDVDLASLREDEKLEGPSKAPSQSDPDTSPEKVEAFPILPGVAPAPSSPTSSSSTYNATGMGELSPAASLVKDLPGKRIRTSGTRHQRTLSDILQPISNANEAVRSTAEEGFKSISNTLDNSFQFLLGRLKERGGEGPNIEVILPKTLDEARQLVNRSLTPEEDDHALSESSSMNDGQSSPMPSNLSKTEEKLLGMLGGRKSAVRERSVDSVKSTASASGKRVGFMSNLTDSPPNGVATMNAINTAQKPSPIATQAASNNPLDTVKNLGNSLNPMNHIGSAFGGAFGRFGGRASASPPSAPTLPNPNPTIVLDTGNEKDGSEDKTQEAEEVSLRAPEKDELPSIRAAPPVPRFLTIGDANELKLGEVQDLLDDYQRLAKVLSRLQK